MSSGLHGLQWLGIQTNGLHPSSLSIAGQSLYMGVSADTVHIVMSEFTVVFSSWSESWAAQWRSRVRSPLCVCCSFIWGKYSFPPIKSKLSGVSVFQFNVCVFVARMITLKVLNSIVLLGTSCIFVKEANMEEKLFDPPPSAVSSRVNSRANRIKIIHTAPQKGGERLICIPK